MIFPVKFCFRIAFVFGFLHLGEGNRFRIVGGRKASITEFPYQVELEKFFFHLCGGSVIRKDFVITAAHCVYSMTDITPVPVFLLRIRAGSDKTNEGGVIHEVDYVIAHENYSSKAKMDEYDVALLKVVQPFKFNDRVQAIPLAEKTPLEGDMAWITGYGRQDVMRSGLLPDNLMAVQLPTISLSRCRKMLSNVADDMICAGKSEGHEDACAGDSGGPMAVNNVLVGLVAWGKGCGREGIPGVYTNVAFHRNWIIQKMNTPYSGF